MSDRHPVAAQHSI